MGDLYPKPTMYRCAYCAVWFGTVAVDCGDDDDAPPDVNQFRRYGSRFVVVVVLLTNTDRLLDMPLLPVFVGVRPLNSGEAVGALPCTWALVNWIEPIPLATDGIELTDTLVILCCVVFEYWLFGDHCDISSSKISTQFALCFFLFLLHFSIGSPSQIELG